MSKQYYRDRIASRRRDILRVREDIVRLRASKKRTNQSLAASIRNTKNQSMKFSYRRQKLNSSQNYDRQIDSKRQELVRIKKDIAGLRVSMAREKS